MNDITIFVETKEKEGMLVKSLHMNEIEKKIHEECFNNNKVRLHIISERDRINQVGLYSVKLKINEKIEVPFKVWVVRSDDIIVTICDWAFACKNIIKELGYTHNKQFTVKSLQDAYDIMNKFVEKKCVVGIKKTEANSYLIGVDNRWFTQR